MSKKKTALKIILPVLILILGLVGMRFLLLQKSLPQRHARSRPGALVEVLVAKQVDRPVRVFATGTVQVDQEVTIVPQVSGRVVTVAPNMVAGGFFNKGELLFGLESTDYELAVQQARAVLARAESDLLLTKGRAAVARQEWTRLNQGRDIHPNPLVVMEPQLNEKQAGLESARAGLRQAELNLARTRITAPFNCRVRSEQVGIGQYIRSGSSVATVAGIDTAEIVVPLEPDDLAWLTVPRPGDGRQGPAATVRLTVNTRKYEWPGRVVRSLGELDEFTRMARVVIRVEHPYRAAADTLATGPDLVQGSFVEVEIIGRTINGVTILPRKVIRDNDSVWVLDDADTLRVRPVTVVRREKDAVWISSGLDNGERVILTNLAGGAQGMALRVVGREADK
ncbi:MAG: efflux RND transporter periplasmic adaptor subunit [Desulfobacterales bacterium]|nr:efflux RND transporter periplasmic adaptor subunit [Desulfobacterales bacterium]